MEAGLSLAGPLLPLLLEMLDPSAICQNEWIPEVRHGQPAELSGFGGANKGKCRASEYNDDLLPNKVAVSSKVKLRDGRLATSMQEKGEAGFDRCTPKGEAAGQLRQLQGC